MKKINIPPIALLSAWSVVILIALLYPKIPSPSSKLIGIDKLVHFSLFFVFAFLFLRLPQKTKKKQYFYFWVTAVIIPIFGEVIQIPVPGREFCFFDILANFTGFAVVIFFYHKERYKKVLLFIKKKLLFRIQ